MDGGGGWVGGGGGTTPEAGKPCWGGGGSVAQADGQEDANLGWDFPRAKGIPLPAALGHTVCSSAPLPPALGLSPWGCLL